MKIFGVTGNPILHSLSPRLFKAAYGSDSVYLRLIADGAAEALAIFDDLAMEGLNVTAPFKAIDLWREGARSESVQQLGLTNTIVRREDGLHYFNTDPDGVTYKLGDVVGKKCLVLGAGGAGMVAAYALQRKGAEVTIANRTVEKARAFATKIGASFAALDCPTTEYDLIVNTLKVKVLDSIGENQLLVDAIYHHSPYENVQCRSIDGSQWLIGQGIAAYRLFTSCEPNVAGMEQFSIPRYRTIALVGDGRPQMARKLSDRCGCEVVWGGEPAENRMILWLHNNAKESQSDKERYALVADAVMNVAQRSENEIIERLYEEIHKIL